MRHYREPEFKNIAPLLPVYDRRARCLRSKYVRGLVSGLFKRIARIGGAPC